MTPGELDSTLAVLAGMHPGRSQTQRLAALVTALAGAADAATIAQAAGWVLRNLGDGRPAPALYAPVLGLLEGQRQAGGPRSMS